MHAGAAIAQLIAIYRGQPRAHVDFRGTPEAALLPYVSAPENLLNDFPIHRLFLLISKRWRGLIKRRVNFY